MPELYSRAWTLENIEIVRSGDGRTVEAYAAVFDTPTEVNDTHGHYLEVIDRAAFNRTLNGGAGRQAVCLYNHGMTLDGRPDSLGQVPIGTPLQLHADTRGLLTVTRFNRSALADSVLEAIRAGDIRSYSFRGRVFRSHPTRVPAARDGQLPTITRLELGLTDYGPTPVPYYEAAAVLAVRSAAQLAEDVAALDQAQRAELIRVLSSTTPPAGPDTTTATPDTGPGAEDPPRSGHSGRHSDLAAHIRRATLVRGIR